MKTPKSLLLISLALGTSSLLAGCGGDDAGGNPIDAADHDAETVPPDSMPPTATRAMTIAVTDVTLTSEDAKDLGVNGGVISAEFSDLTAAGGTVLHGTTPIGGCLVIKYDATHPPRPVVDGGEITIEATTEGTTLGIKKAMGPCTFSAGAGYTCSSHAGAAQAITATNLSNSVSSPPGTISYTFPTQAFPVASNPNLVGAYLVVGGFAEGFNTPAGAAFPIIAQINPATGNPSTTTLIVVNPAGEALTTETTAAGTFKVLNGFQPAPVGAAGDFLSTNSGTVSVEKAANAEWGAVAFSSTVTGQGFALRPTSAQPHEFPGTAAPLIFTCDDGTTDSCGDVGSAFLQAFIVSGRTTDADVSGLEYDFLMPPVSAATEYTTFQCGVIGEDSVTMPIEAITAILSTNPTMIETRVLRVGGATPNDSLNVLNTGTLVIGHGLVGHTILP